MLKISAKGTVPVLHLQDRVIDESLEIISWALESNPENVHQCAEQESQLTNYFIELFDSQFKYHLDRYKYSSRYGSDVEFHQAECLKILNEFEKKISPAPWCFGLKISLLDISVLPFIRQCKIANKKWFNSQDFLKAIALLNYFEDSKLYNITMEKYELWDENDPSAFIFPKEDI